MSDDDEDDPYPDSGPFCRHWSEAGCCDRVCAACGHACGLHNDGEYDEDCNERGCACQKFEDEESQT